MVHASREGKANPTFSAAHMYVYPSPSPAPHPQPERVHAAGDSSAANSASSQRHSSTFCARLFARQAHQHQNASGEVPAREAARHGAKLLGVVRKRPEAVAMQTSGLWRSQPIAPWLYPLRMLTTTMMNKTWRFGYHCVTASPMRPYGITVAESGTGLEFCRQVCVRPASMISGPCHGYLSEDFIPVFAV